MKIKINYRNRSLENLAYKPVSYPIIEKVYRILPRECRKCNRKIDEHYMYQVKTPLKSFYICQKCGKEKYNQSL